MKKDPVILHIESATELCSVAISKGEVLLGFAKSVRKFDHASRMLLMVEQCLQQANISKSDLDAVAVGLGPGSYTGLRVALSTAKGLCMALNIPLIGLSTLEIIVRGVMGTTEEAAVTYIPMIDARRDEVYYGVYNDDVIMVESAAPFIITPESIHALEAIYSNILFCGNGSGKIHQFAALTHRVKVRPNDPSSRDMIWPAIKKWAQKDFLNLFSATPTYLKNPNITRPKPRITH